MFNAGPRFIHRATGADNPLNLKQLSALASILLLALSGCIFSPKKKVGNPPIDKPSYSLPWSPDLVLQNYVKAYNYRDSTQMQLIYDDAYLGKSYDATQPIDLQTSHFTKADEVSHTGRLYRDAAIQRVELSLGTNFLRSTDLGDPPGWATLQTNFQSLSVYVIEDGQNNTYELHKSGEAIVFKFIPKTPDSSSETDTTWKLIQWNESYVP